jgi:hypothetical protein
MKNVSKKVDSFDEALKAFLLAKASERDPENINEYAYGEMLSKSNNDKGIDVKNRKLHLYNLTKVMQEMHKQKQYSISSDHDRERLETLSQKIKQNKRFYDRLHTYCRKFVLLDTYERTTTGVLTLVLLFSVVVPSVLNLMSIRISWSNDVLKNFIQGLEFICHFYCAIVVMIYIFLWWLSHKSDSFSFMAKVLKTSWSEVHEKINSTNRNGNCQYSFRLLNEMNYFNDLVTLTDMGSNAYGNFNSERHERLKKYTEWYKWRKDIFNLICDEHNNKIGFICVLPLNTEKGQGGRNHYDGLTSQFEINSEMIARGNSNLLFLQGIYLEPRFAYSIPALVTCLTCFYKKAAELMEIDDKRIDTTVIYAEPVTTQNSKLLKALGFSFYKKYSKNRTKLFEIRFQEKSLPENAYNSLIRIKEFQDKLLILK